jgi:hypothetical protein
MFSSQTVNGTAHFRVAVPSKVAMPFILSRKEWGNTSRKERGQEGYEKMFYMYKSEGTLLFERTVFSKAV